MTAFLSLTLSVVLGDMIIRPNEPSIPEKDEEAEEEQDELDPSTQLIFPSDSEDEEHLTKRTVLQGEIGRAHV